jgi:hypothetical protein
MDVLRVFLAAVACLGFAGPVAQAQDVDPEAVATEMARATGPAKPWKHVRGFGRVLDLRNPPVVIDQPGLYAIDRNWRFPGSDNVLSGLIQITANEVTLDLHGFAILADYPTALVITAASAEVRNGVLSACCTDGRSVAVDVKNGASLHHLSIFSYERMNLEDSEGGVAITDSLMSVRSGVRFGDLAIVDRNTIHCSFACATLVGDGNQLTNNRFHPFSGGGIDIEGNRNLVGNNVIDLTNIMFDGEAFKVEGDFNVVRGNTVLFGGFEEPGVPVPGSPPPIVAGPSLWVISGTANTLDGNIAPPPGPGRQRRIGMEFTADGNFYGNNRMAAQTPFALGGTVQIDWGGNVGY